MILQQQLDVSDYEGVLLTTRNRVHKTGSPKSIPSLSPQDDKQTAAMRSAFQHTEAHSLTPVQPSHGRRPDAHFGTSVGCTDTAPVDYRAEYHSRPRLLEGQAVDGNKPQIWGLFQVKSLQAEAGTNYFLSF